MRKGCPWRRGAAAAACLLLLAAALLALAAREALWPQSGDRTRSDGDLVVDESHSADGYLIIHGPKTSRRLKLRIALGEEMYTYDLNGSGESEVFPLQMGDGQYTCTLYANTEGSKYAQSGRVTVSVSLSDEAAPFLAPNQEIWYTQDSAAVQKSYELCEGLSSDAEKFDAIRQFIEKKFVYDFVATITTQKGALPDVDRCYETRKGICQDLAAVTACMLRVQGIPAKMAVGHADSMYHAWVSVWLDGQWQRYDPTAGVHGVAEAKNYTEEKCY